MAPHPKYKIAVWNANGLNQHLQEIKTFLTHQNIDLMLISETHLTDKHYIKIPTYKIYDTKHPTDKARGGTAILIRESIKHHEMDKYRKENIQATTIQIVANSQPMNVSSIYCPPKHNNKEEDFQKFFKTLGSRFLAGGDFNAKNRLFGSRTTTTKGRELAKSLKSNNMSCISTGEPTYWPSDKNKTPDLLDFCVTKGIDTKKININSCFDLSSDHSPIILEFHNKILINEKKPTLHTSKTDWNKFRQELDKLISLKIKLKTEQDIDTAVDSLQTSIQKAAWNATPGIFNTKPKDKLPAHIVNKIYEKRRLRKTWQRERTTINKNLLNRATKELKDLLNYEKNSKIQEFLENLTANEKTDYSLWKATRRLKRGKEFNPPIRSQTNDWARSDEEKSQAFATHLSSTFVPFPSNDKLMDNEISKYMDSPYQMDYPINKFTNSELIELIKEINPKKSPGHDLISGKILKEATQTCYKAITQIFNAIIRINYFPSLWKLAEIIMILKPGKKPDEVKSYRPISLLPILSKIFEKLLMKRLHPIIQERRLLPNHQFGFRSNHGTIEQVHRVVNEIQMAMESRKYCSAVFLDVTQAFDKVWHDGLLYKLKRDLPYHYYQIIKS